MLMRCATALLAGGVVALSACGAEGPVGPAKPAYLGTTVTPNAVNVLSAVATVRAAGFDSAAIRHWTGSEAPHRTPAVPFGADSTAIIPVLGLAASATHQFETVLYTDHADLAVDTAAFLAGALPSWIPPMGSAGSDTTAGLVALSLPDGGVIVDNTGQVVWYVHSPAGVLNSFQAHANGSYTVLRADDTGVFHVLDVLG